MISEFFVDRPIFANVIAFVTIVIGLVALYILPVAQYPNIVPPTIQVSTSYPGASAEVVAKTIGVPIEQAVNGVENAIYMSSVSASDGSYLLTITFKVGTDLNTSIALVQNLVNGALAQLPAGATNQGVSVKKVSPNILLVVSLYSPDNRYSEKFLSNYAIINLLNPLARIPGVAQTRVFGSGAYSMRVWLDPYKLQYYGLTTTDVMGAIQGQNVQVATGRLGAPPVPKGQPLEFTVSTLGRLSNAAQFENIIVKSAGSALAPQIVRLKDVAKIELGQQSYANFAYANGLNTALIPVFGLPDANAITVANHVYKSMATMSKEFPSGLKYRIPYDTTKFVREAISKVYETLIIAGILVLIVVMLFLQNLRAMLVPATTVPVTIIGAFIAIAALGFSVNLMTLFALILAIGIVVDDAIVIVEGTSYHIEQGMAPREATLKAMSELTGPVIGITLALVSVFLPAAFFPGITGQIFRQFALVIAATAVISAINALTLKPVQCAYWLKPHSEKRPNWFYRGFNQFFEWLTDLYMGIVRAMVKRPFFMLLVFIGIISFTAWQFIERPTGFLPTEDQGYGVLLCRLPEGASLDRNNAVATKINHILKHAPGVAGWVTIGGFSFLDFASESNYSSTFVTYQDWDKRGSALSQEKILGYINSHLATLQDAQAMIITPPPIRGLGQTGGFQLELEDRGNLGMKALQKAATGLQQAAFTQHNLQYLQTTFNTSNPELYLDIDRTKAEALQVPLASVFATLQSYLGSSFVNLFNKFNQVYQVYVQAGSKYRLSPADIGNLYVRNTSGGMVPLSTLLSVKHTLGSEVITRYNLYPAATFFGQAAHGYSSGQALSTMENLAAHTLPPGIDYDWTSTSYQEKQVGNQAYFIYALSIFLVYMVLAALYESWTSPAAIILVVPIALVGVLVALWLRGNESDLYTQVGLVLMIALASKNAILIVEFARDLHKAGMSVSEAAIEATRRRFRPILMTSFAFILGVFPLVVAFGAGAASQQDLGTVVFGGMIASTLLAIPFVPVFFVLFERLSERMHPAKSVEETFE